MYPAEVKCWNVTNWYCCSLPYMSYKLRLKSGPLPGVDAWSILSSVRDVHENKSFMVTLLKEISAFS